MKEYEVLSRIKHNGKYYEVGDFIELKNSEVAPLVLSGSISDKSFITVETTDTTEKTKKGEKPKTPIKTKKGEKPTKTKIEKDSQDTDESLDDSKDDEDFSDL